MYLFLLVGIYNAIVSLVNFFNSVLMPLHYRKETGYKIFAQNSVLFLCTNNELSKKKKFKRQFHLQLHTNTL